MSYELSKKLFKYFIDLLRLVQLVSIFLCFFINLYWVLQLAGATFIQPVAPFFEAIRQMAYFFNPKIVNANGVTIDFAFLEATIFILAFVWGLKIFIELLEFLGKKSDAIHKKVKKKNEELFNLKLEKEYFSEEYKNNKVFMVVRFVAKNLTKDSFFNRDVNVGVEEKEREILFNFLEILDEDIKCQKKVLDEGVLLLEDFKNIDNFIYSLGRIIKELKSKYYEEKWQLDFHMGIDVYADPTEIEPKMEKITVLTNLGFEGKIACLGTFKQRYSLSKNPKYRIQDEGIYQINNTEEEVFCIKS